MQDKHKRRLTALEAEQARTIPPDRPSPLFWQQLDRAYGTGAPSEPMDLAASMALIDSIYAEEEINTQ